MIYVILRCNERHYSDFGFCENALQYTNKNLSIYNFKEFKTFVETSKYKVSSDCIIVCYEKTDIEYLKNNFECCVIFLYYRKDVHRGNYEALKEFADISFEIRIFALFVNEELKNIIL